MMWLLLFGSTALVALLPLLPAIAEWRRPSDVVPLRIDSQDALDPPFLARSFVTRLDAALAAGEGRLGHSPIVEAPAQAAWPLDARERGAAASQRVWHARGDAELPVGIKFFAEVAAHGVLRSATGGVYRALWAGRQLVIAPESTLLRWAHGARVDVGAGCRLAGRVSADESITVGAATSFTLLHAPRVRFGSLATAASAASTASAAPAASAAAPDGVFRLGLPKAVVWNAAAARGTCDGPLAIDARRAWRGDLVCSGDLRLGTGCNVHGSLKSNRDIAIDSGSSVLGSVVAEGRITLGARCNVRGSVVSEMAVALGEGCVIGAPGHPATVAAPRIEVAPGVVVHGTLWAGTSGQAMSSASALQAAESPAPAIGAASAEPAIGAASAEPAIGAASAEPVIGAASARGTAAQAIDSAAARGVAE